MNRSSVCVICLPLLLAGVLLAQEPNDAATKEDIQSLFGVMNSQKQMTAVIDVMKQQMPALTSQVRDNYLPNATPDERAKMEAFQRDSMEKAFRTMPIQEMMGAMMPAYQHHLTHFDAQQLIRFYSSPTGQKLLNEMPAILAEGMQAMNPLVLKWVDERVSEVRKSAEEFAKSLRTETQRSEVSTNNLEVLSDTMGVDFKPYLGNVLKEVRKNWYSLIPPVARAPQLKEGDVTIEFAILKDGRVKGMRLTAPSGDVSLDRAAWGGITGSDPFPPLPDKFTGSYLALRFHFCYNPHEKEKTAAISDVPSSTPVPPVR